MARPHHGHHLLVEQRFGHQVRRRIARFQAADEQVDLSQPQLRQQAREIALFHQYRGFGRLLLEHDHGACQQHGHRDHHRTHARAAGSAALHGTDLVARALVVGEHGAREAQQHDPAGRGHGTPAGPVEQLQAQHALDLGQHPGYGRLAHGHELGRAPEVAELVERHDQLQVTQLDVGTQDAVDGGHGAS